MLKEVHFFEVQIQYRYARFLVHGEKFGIRELENFTFEQIMTENRNKILADTKEFKQDRFYGK